MRKTVLFMSLVLLIVTSAVLAQNESIIAAEKFSQLKEELPTPNTYRIASGAP